jgi:hypothetical protein
MASSHAVNVSQAAPPKGVFMTNTANESFLQESESTATMYWIPKQPH